MPLIKNTASFIDRMSKKLFPLGCVLKFKKNFNIYSQMVLMIMVSGDYILSVGGDI